MKPGQIERRTHDYVRNGTTDPFFKWVKTAPEILVKAKPKGFHGPEP